MRRQSIAQALKSPAIRRALNEIAGKPTGGWAETTQARRALVDALPIRRYRAYSAATLIEVTLDASGSHYRWRAGVR